MASELLLEVSFFVQQDNDPKPTARAAKEWLSNNLHNAVQIPSQLLNINVLSNCETSSIDMLRNKIIKK